MIHLHPYIRNVRWLVKWISHLPFCTAIGVPIPSKLVGNSVAGSHLAQYRAIDSYEVSGVVAQIGATRFKYLVGRTDGREELFDLDSNEAENSQPCGPSCSTADPDPDARFA